MQLSVSGHPLHTRAQHVTLSRRGDGAVVALATHLDLRKHGFVPVGADLQGAGVIHDMRIEALIDPRTRVIESARAAMPTVALEPSALTRGESCRDVGAKIEALAGVALDAEYVRRLRAGFAGVLGCSHLLTLAQLLGLTVAHALDRATEDAMDWQEGAARRLFSRSLIVDGHLHPSGDIELAAQMVDLYFAAAPAVANPMRRFVRQDETRALARVARQSLRFAELRVGERSRRLDSLAQASWCDRPEVGELLRETPLLGGLMRVAAARFGGEARPLCDLLQSLPGTYLQVMGALSEAWPERVAQADTVVGIGATPDSCYMWRRDGALHAARKDSDPQPRS